MCRFYIFVIFDWFGFIHIPLCVTVIVYLMPTYSVARRQRVARWDIWNSEASSYALSWQSRYLYGAIHYITVGQESSVGIETRCGLDGPWIESRLGGGQDFPHTFRPPWGPNGKKRWRPTSSSAEVKERVELYIYPPLWSLAARSRVNFIFLKYIADSFCRTVLKTVTLACSVNWIFPYYDQYILLQAMCERIHG